MTARLTYNRTAWTAQLDRLKAFVRRPPAWSYEWLVIAVWALWLGSVYLNLNPYLWPAGSEMGNKLFGHQMWVNLLQCGLCAFWNGSLNGGHPALADLFGSQLHPLIAVTTLLFGVINGLKFAEVGILILAGLAQWGIARQLNLGRVARVWSGLLAVAGGHLAIQQWNGSYGLSLALVSTALVIAAVLAFARAPTRRHAVLLGLAGALLIVSGQGYVQVVVATWAPALLIFRFQQTRAQAAHFFRELLVAVGLSALLSATLLVPTIHYWPNFSKDTATDPTFAYAQPFEYVPLSFVINDPAYYVTASLGKNPTADLPYIGWVPILLALAGLRFFKARDLPALGFLLVTAVITMLLTAAIPFRWFSSAWPYFLWLKHPHVIVSAAVPSLLGLAAFGLDRLWNLAWPRLQMAFNSSNSSNAPTNVTFNTQWLLLLPLLASLATTKEFVERYTVPVDMTTVYTQYIEHFHTDSAQWISPPGEPVWTQPALERGYKVTDRSFSGSAWSGRFFPAAYLISVRGEFASDQPFEQVVEFDGLSVYRLPLNEYAYVTYPDGIIVPCPATSVGGFISVRCTTERDGVLTVTENTWGGWFAWQDGQPTAVFANDNPDKPWLLASAPNGVHTYEFKYLPWDGFLGIALTVLGFYLAVRWWRQEEPAPPGATA